MDIAYFLYKYHLFRSKINIYFFFQIMKFAALIFTFLVLSQASTTLEQQDSQFTVSQDYDEIEKFFLNHVVPLYQHIKASNNLNLTIKAVLGSFFIAFCIRVCLNIISGKDQDSDLIKEIRDLKKQFKALKEEKSNNNNKESLDEIKNELKSLRETLKENETSTSDLLKQKEKLDGFVMDFQTEVVDSHKAIWTELRALKRIVSHKKPAGIKIPPKEKQIIIPGYCQSADLEGASKPEPQTSLPTIVNTDRKKSATVAPTQTKQSIFAKNSRKLSEPESSGRQIDSAETKAEPDSGFPRENESPSAPEAQTPLTQLIKKATNTLSASMFEDSPLKGDVFLTPKPLGSKRMTILSSRKIVANSPRPLVPQSLF